MVVEVRFAEAGATVVFVVLGILVAAVDDDDDWCMGVLVTVFPALDADAGAELL